MEPVVTCRGSSLKVASSSTRAPIPTVAPLKIRKRRKPSGQVQTFEYRSYDSETEESFNNSSGHSRTDTADSTISVPLSPKLRPSNYDLQRFYRIHELYAAEVQFARDMACVVRVYLATCSLSGLSHAQKAVLFAHTADVFSLSLKLLCALETMVPEAVLKGCIQLAEAPSANCVTLVGNALSETLTPELYGVYEAYTYNSSRQMELCFDLVKTRPGCVGPWLDECYAKTRHLTDAWSLDALLIRPVQQLGRYLLFMKAILKVTPRDHADYDGVLKAHNRVTHYIECIDKRV